MYTLELGQTEKTLARQAYMSGEGLPDRIKNAPRLTLGLQLYLQAFFDLDSERTHHTGLTPISRRAMWEYAHDYDLDEEQRDDLMFLVRKIDTAHLKRLGSKIPPLKV